MESRSRETTPTKEDLDEKYLDVNNKKVLEKGLYEILERLYSIEKRISFIEFFVRKKFIFIEEENCLLEEYLKSDLKE